VIVIVAVFVATGSSAGTVTLKSTLIVSVAGSNWKLVTGVIAPVLTATHVANELCIVAELVSLLLKFHKNAGLVPESKPDAALFD
jgi:hypothetical protein